MLTSKTRKIKQANIVCIWAILILGVFAMAWYFIAIPEPLGEIQPLLIGEVKSNLTEKEKAWEPPFNYQVFTSIQNPNEEFIAKKINCVFQAQGDNNENIGQTEITVKREDIEKKEITIAEKLILQERGRTLIFQITDIEWDFVSAEEKTE